MTRPTHVTPGPGLQVFPPLAVGRGKRKQVSADWLSEGAKKGELRDLKGQGNAPPPQQAGGREREEGEAEFGRLKGVWRDSDCSWAPPSRFRFRLAMGETEPYPKKTVAVTGLGLGLRVGEKLDFFFL